MPDQKPEVSKVTMSNTKREMLSAYRELVKRLEEKREAEVKPEQVAEERQEREAVAVADSLSLDGIAGEIGGLKSEVGKLLGQLGDRLEDELAKYQRIRRAAELRAKELQEIYEIEKAASSLTALIEAQKEKREHFESEMAARKAELQQEAAATRKAWEAEQQAHQAAMKEREEAEKKRRDREADEFQYKLTKEQERAREEFEHEKARLERESQYRREELEREMADREKALNEREAELAELRQRAADAPAQLDAAVSKAVEETTQRLGREAKAREDGLGKDFEGEKNVLLSRIEALEQTVQEQRERSAALSAQLDKSYGQVQDIAVKAIEGSASSRLVASLASQSAAAAPVQEKGKGD